MRSLEHTPKSVLDQAAKSIASDCRSRSNTGKHGSQLASPPSEARSLLNSAAQSERGYSGSECNFPIASPRLKKSQNTSPGFPTSQPGSPRRNNGSSYDQASQAASSASAARSPGRSPGHSPLYCGSAQRSRDRTAFTNSGIVSANDIQSINPRSSRSDKRGSSSRMNTTDTRNNNLPSRGTTTGSVRSVSACSSVSHRSKEGSPASGRCSPPTPPSPSPSYSPD